MPIKLCCIVLFITSLFAYASESPIPAKVYTIAVNTHSYPYHFIDEQGNADGLMIDIWKLWAKKNDLNVKFVILEWQQTLEQVKSGQIDIHAGLSETINRANYLDFSTPFFNHGSYIFVHRDLEHIKSIEHLKPYTVAVPINSSHEEQIPQTLDSLKMRLYKGRHNMYKAVLNNEVLAFAGLSRISKNYARRAEISSLFPPYRRINYKSSKYVSAVAKGNDVLLNLINSGMEKITREQQSQLERKWLGIDKKRDAITLVYSPDLAPYSSASNAGEAKGLFPDIWRKWSEQTGRDIQFVARDYKDSIKLLASREADVHISYPQLDYDKSLYSAVNQKYEIKMELFASESMKKRVLANDDLTEYKIGIFDVANRVLSLTERYPQLNFKVYQTYHELLAAAERKEVNILLGELETIKAHLLDGNFTRFNIAESDFNINVELNIVVKKDNKTLVNIINEGFSELSLEILSELERKWLEDSTSGYFNRISNLVDLSQQEELWLKDNPEIKIGVHHNFPPLEFIDSKTGLAQGINIDFLKLITERTGLKFEVVPFNSWQEQFMALKQGKTRLLGNATETDRRKVFFRFSESYWDMPWVILHPKKNIAQSSLTYFYGKKLAVVKQYHLNSWLRSEHPMINLVLVDDYEQGVKAIEQGMVAGLLENIATASELIKKDRLVELDISVVNELAVDKTRFAMAKNDIILNNIINKALKSISTQESQQIYEKWFSINLETGFNKEKVLKVSLQVGVVILVVIAFIGAWNRRLYIEVERRKVLEEKMKHMASYDDLTGLANRVLLKDRLITAINVHKRQKKILAVLFIDLDGFKIVNDSYGHDVGDKVLQEVASRLKICVRESDTVVRFGGDEFVVMLTGLKVKEEAKSVALKILKELGREFTISEQVANLGGSIGIAIYPEDGDTDIELLKTADTLMYKVKAEGKNGYTFA